ncbi:maleylpyruvate isomerase family mycothiol-dependent enzyme [Actinomadura sp. ATCC 31491]|uniref:Maleylpyruvate isomerase family mycothiol-dependent enzyme n=1 Tax=Actinomadura luzonensis TaxID=2805427 RepID=A0ABT0FU80_9ACTN|nr:maleylpyruvate isomerase family mycothiol-dependent enzyme [Actinomadura luzonensis]MCK2215458.1 maleylpyruvate isomerase family mycothiol-dependent enzyme [Actinomadura luzonensis]
MSSADTVIAVLRTGHDDLAGLVSGLGDDDLARPSGAAEWDVSQVLGHLGSGAEIGLAVLQAALKDEPGPGHDFNQSVWDRWDAMSRRERADGFLRAGQDLTALYESLDAAARDNLRIDLGFLPAPADVGTVARMRLSELALHAWDVRVAFDEHATLAPDATAVLLREGPDLFAWIGKVDRLGGRSLVVTVSTTEPDSVFALRLRAPISVDADVPERPDGTLALPAEAWLRLVAGRLAPAHTPGGVVTTGAADLDLLREVFPGY